MPERPDLRGFASLRQRLPTQPERRGCARLAEYPALCVVFREARARRRCKAAASAPAVGRSPAYLIAACECGGLHPGPVPRCKGAGC